MAFDFDLNQMVKDSAKRDEERVQSAMTDLVGLLVRTINKSDDPDHAVSLIEGFTTYLRGEQDTNGKQTKLALGSGSDGSDTVTPEERAFINAIKEAGIDLPSAPARLQRLMNERDYLETENTRLARELENARQQLANPPIDGDKVQAERDRDRYKAERDNALERLDTMKQDRDRLQSLVDQTNKQPSVLAHTLVTKKLAPNAEIKGGKLPGTTEKLVITVEANELTDAEFSLLGFKPAE